MGAPLAEPTAQVTDFRRRLLDGLAVSIRERGYRETTVADIVRAARTSKRTFYDHFATKEECFVELLSANNDDLVAAIRAALDATRGNKSAAAKMLGMAQATFYGRLD